ncbi:MAG: hypothetical protein HY897_03140 [Deltaproteobacteria bacterium]|nr:hypothetical protein [Deltaproteobacteria bacterium]
MFPKYCLFLLPVHRRCCELYRTDKRLFRESEIRKWEAEKRHVFERMDVVIRDGFERTWTLPDWFFNDIIGFVEVGYDGGIYLQGAVYFYWNTCDSRFIAKLDEAGESDQVLGIVLGAPPRSG